ncbi:MAG: hypothetical protein SCH98_01840 [Deferrisomatales bacterium]|nr:hypothetical protein [Deferrisomatales bacterium]
MKKKHALALAGIGLAALAAVAVAAVSRTSAPPPLQVNDVRSDPTAFQGTLTVIGIMAAVSPTDPTVFGVMDKSELLCTSPNCNKFFLPVRYEGPRPAHGDEVEVTGTFTHGGRLLTATAVKTLRNHKI